MSTDAEESTEDRRKYDCSLISNICNMIHGTNREEWCFRTAKVGRGSAGEIPLRQSQFRSAQMNHEG